MRDAGLVRRWSRRDWLSAAVVAATTAFLVGTALLLLSAGAYTSTLEGGLATATTVEYVENGSVTASDGGDRIVIPAAVATVEGTRTRVLAVPPDAPTIIPGASVEWKPARMPQPTANAAVGPVAYRQEVTFEGEAGTVTATVRPPEESSVFPARWYAARPAVADALGVEGAFVIDPAADDEPLGDTGVPLIGTVPFILLGIRDVLRILSLAGVAGGVVVLVVVYSVTRMSVRDRRTTVRVLRATGADPLRVGGLIAARAVAVTAVGVLAGALAGVAAPEVLVAAATALGFPVSLPTAVTPEKLRVTAAVTTTLTLAGAAAGVAAAVPSVRVPPAAVGDERAPARARLRDAGGTLADGGPRGSVGTRVRAALRPRLLGWRAAVPTAATLAVFVLIVLVVGGLVGTLAPLAGTDTGTITEPGATHPLNSRIDADYARVLRAQGVAASPEVIAAQVSDGEPYLARGANYTAFARVTGAELIAGRPPDGPGEAVIGAGLARTLGVEVGDRLTIGGSVSPAIDRVEIVGRYEAAGLVDDQLVVPLATVAPAATGSTEQVHLIRTEAAAADALAREGTEPRLVVTRVRTPETVTAGEPTPVSVTVRNFGGAAGSRVVTVETDGRTIRKRVELASGAATTVSVNVTWGDTGTYPVVVGPFERDVTVTRPGALTLPAEFPRRAPPDSTLLIPAVTTNGTRVSDAEVRFGEFTAPTNAEGVATVPVPQEPGTYPVVVSAPGRESFRTTVEVTPNATKEVSARIQLDPESGTPVTRPNVTVVVANPWGSTLVRNLTLVMPTGVEERTVRLAPGNVSRVRVEPGAAGFDGEVEPGTYTFRLLSDGELVATARYEVVGAGGATGAAGLPPGAAVYASGTGIGTVITRVFGNVQVLFAGMVLLAGVATVSGTVAAFARAVQSRGRTVGVYRATGMSRRRVLAVVAGDALRLAVPAVAAAFLVAAGVGRLAEALDVLVAFGVRIDLALFSPVVAVALAGSVALAVVSAALATVPFLLAPPSRLLRDGR